MSTTEHPRCKECGTIFNTIEDLQEHQQAEAEYKALRNKKFADG